ncbi:PREDICTED: interleukin-1 receptor-associated kinase 1-binding protein 1-like [Amphimedon queenslandica]|uniref:Uncharacterized protein n=1 Tax=Amphimedon queenslandica TaxID=400682 RepID=A0AAN0IQ04_AMPQE|nr:PREDICTED: interleukin-1 receptor-associated kinase 1-binding protein 1-like [Amphimedon queenslandica]|eukprot:XP_011406266.2 PREDICTED: interleukin-1 receptor-associated kinase 1-binding protein 1-like [Amphimedon queenslandica]
MDSTKCASRCTCTSKNNDLAKTTSGDINNSPTPSFVVSQRTLTVHAEGEVTSEPDRYTLTINITSIKLKLEDAQLSVKRRSDYILQAIRNHNFNNKCIKVLEEAVRLPASVNNRDTEQESHQVKCIINIEGDEMEKVLAIKNLLVEKMDANVVCSAVGCYHSPGHKAKKCEEAFKCAVSLAKAKANSVTQSLGVQLGSILNLIEEGRAVENKDTQNYCIDIKNYCILTYTTTVSAIFEVLPIKRRK